MHWVCSTIGCWPNPPFHGVCTQLGSSDRGTKMNKGPCQGRKESKNTWLVVWNMNFIFPYIGNNHPNWFSYFSKGLAQPPTRYVAIFSLQKWHASKSSQGPNLWCCWRPRKVLSSMQLFIASHEGQKGGGFVWSQWDEMMVQCNLGICYVFKQF